MPQGQRNALIDNPGWMCLCILGSGWAAASTGSEPWIRVASLVLMTGWVGILGRHLLRRRRNTAPTTEPGD